MSLSPDASKTCRVLAVDGGGIRGVIPATILASLEKAVGVPLAQCFHVVGGTSTGGILASGLACEIPTSQLVDFYQQKGPGIFSSYFFGSVDGPKYPADALEAALKEAFGDKQLSDLPHDLLCPAYDLTARQGILFKSWKARGIEEPSPNSSDFLVRDVARSTAAAPTFFSPSQITAADGKTYALIDGGVYGNNPALIAFVAARRLMPLASRYLVVSIGTGESLTPIAYADAKNWGLVGWGTKIIDVMFDAMGSTVEYELDQLAGVWHLRLQSSLQGANEAMDDASATNMRSLAACANRTLSDRSADVASLLEELKTPLPDRIGLGYPTTVGATRPSRIADFPLQQIQQTAAASSPIAAVHGAAAAIVDPRGPWAAVLGGTAGAVAGGALAGAAFGGPFGLLVGAAAGFLLPRLVSH